ncbi:extracellular solute-binding protein [Verminephrobacter aporrectodeae subsp. tuberculatae]|uniref:ABC transporter substrate-binding protein n=1 Tax=Verminephrobacter aporrectodeae TaxID=1110389 RepID=UPI002237C7A6|nr:extracellular solute-binding protein [Verminephrobacter aporrectodeae]MCW5222219.1 extracellular solute-binding protein [Verminephrobacter aporrectodeae subsp. tuberculatae]MCW5287683.1 extracellular solute-binding protein [Verminephrobacter aporrectodeae subsp. tuberculatae]
MSETLKALARACHAQRLDRRGFLARAAALGFSASAAGLMLNAVSTEALAEDGGVDFMKHKGKTIRLLLNKHPYVDAMVRNIENFKTLTGLNVGYDIFPEDVYFDKVTAALASKSSQYDAFMTGAYQTWKYGPARQIVDLNQYLTDPRLTSAHYAWDDVYQNLRAATAWDGRAGSALGGPGAKQWALPWGFELNSLSYNKRLFDSLKLSVPTNLADMADKAARISRSGKGYGIGVRGSRSWATIHAGFLSAYTNFGNKDFTSADDKLAPAMNTPQSKQFHQQWIDMVKNGGPKNWTNYTWYEVGNDLGAGNSAMVYDADILGYFFNGGSNQEAGNLAYAAFTPNPAAKAPTPNIWIWSLAMSAFSKQKEAAWFLLQWATGTQNTTFGATRGDLVNPVRKSVWENADFKARLDKSYPGYLKQYLASVEGAKIYFTPQQLFPEFTTDWASTLQQMYGATLPVDEGLDKLAEGLTRKLRGVGLA